MQLLKRSGQNHGIWTFTLKFMSFCYLLCGCFCIALLMNIRNPPTDIWLLWPAIAATLGFGSVGLLVPLSKMVDPDRLKVMWSFWKVCVTEYPRLAVLEKLDKTFPPMMMIGAGLMTWILCRAIYFYGVLNLRGESLHRTFEWSVMLMITPQPRALEIITISTLALAFLGPLLLEIKCRRRLNTALGQYEQLNALDHLTTIALFNVSYKKADEYSKQMLHVANQIHAAN